MRIKRKVYGASDDMDREFDMFGEEDPENTSEAEDSTSIKDDISNLVDDVDDLKDLLEDEIFEDGTSIDIDNNIEDHYIAECEQCKGIFISAVIKSDQHVDKISGVCPLCEKSTDQYLKWIIIPSKDV